MLRYSSSLPEKKKKYVNVDEDHFRFENFDLFLNY